MTAKMLSKMSGTTITNDAAKKKADERAKQLRVTMQESETLRLGIPQIISKAGLGLFVLTDENGDTRSGRVRAV